MLCTVNWEGELRADFEHHLLISHRKLALKYREGEAPSILIFSERLGADVPADVESTISAEYQAHLGTFLASLVFWQDLLEHCTSDNVKQTLLDHFRYLFLQQLLLVNSTSRLRSGEKC